MNKLKSIPTFKNEDEERDFWATHDTTEYFDINKPVNLVFPNLKPSTETISLRLPRFMLDQLKKLANKKDVPYQSLIKIFLGEKIKEESTQARQVI
jgi:predicted DNA binding CopG/RHH family protein